MGMDPEQQEQGPPPIKHVQTADLIQNPDTGQCRVTVTKAVRAAGLDEGATFQFKPYEIEELGMIPALGAAADEDATRDRYTRTAASNGVGSIRIALPNEVVEALESETGEKHDDEHPLLVDIFAGERVIALAPAEAIDVPIEALPKDPDRVVDDSCEVLRLEPVQTARPRTKGTDKSRMAQLTATRAIRAAGLASEVDKPYSVSYHPEAVEELGGLVPAVGYQRQAGVLDPEYSIYREQGRGDESQPQVYSIGLPAAIADALGTSIDELEELSKRKRPEITIYAVEGLLGFKMPTVHKFKPIAIAKESSPTSPGSARRSPSGFVNVATSRPRT